jgi:hypothetical protein
MQLNSPITSTRPTPTTRGVLYVHSAVSAMCPHVEWAVAGVLGGSPDFSWVPQPAESGTYRVELSWQAPAGSAAQLASALRGWDGLRFEVTEEPTSTTEGARYSFTPTLGIFHSLIGLHGDVLIPEDRIKAFRVKAALGEVDIDTALDGLLGVAWDAELEPFRRAGEGAPVRWLHQVV